jgi:hypothetical protein
MKDLSSIFITLALFLFLCFTGAFAATEVGTSSPDVFLKIVRNGHSPNTWSMMSGTVEHVRKNEDPTETSIHLHIRFAADRALAKVKLNNAGSFTIGQQYDGTNVSILQDDKTGDIAQNLGNIGLRPEDLTMSFLYWKYTKELPRATIKNIDCRVFELESPDAKEKSVVYIGAKYFVAMRAEFFKTGEQEYYRALTIDSFEKSGDLWAPSSFIITGPGWKTKVVFSSVKMGSSKDKVPEELFKLDAKSN